jgi:hypothetical protein
MIHNEKKRFAWLQPRGEVRWLKHAKTLINEVEPVSFLRLAWSLAGTKQSLYPTYTEQREGGQTHRTYTEQREAGQTHTCMYVEHIQNTGRQDRHIHVCM